MGEGGKMIMSFSSREKRNKYNREYRKKNKKKYKGLHSIWKTMKCRCFSLTHSNYKYYGARGITVCDEWHYNFLSFYNWAIRNERKKGLTLDRINNDGNYCPENCRWVTHLVNVRNSRHTKLTIEDVKEIKRKLLLGILGCKIAEDYPVTEAQISSIKRGKQWSDIKAF